MIAAPTRRRWGSKSGSTSPRCCSIFAMTLMMPIAVGSSIATVAVLETNADSRQVIAPNARMTPVVDLPTPGRLRIQNANRRATPCLSIAAARMNAPMNVKIVDDPNGPSTSSTGATPRKTATATPSRPPTGIGTASLIHSAMTPSSTAASTCCSRGMSIGRTRKTMVSERREEEADGAPALLEAFLLR